MKALIPANKIAALEKVLVQGDLSALTDVQRLDYMKSVCRLLGISMLGRPFDYIKLNGKLTLYANASCAAQLRARHGISIKITERERIDGLYVVTAQARTAKGREDEAIGAINIKSLSGEALANALLKCETKAKRRVTLSLCGLNMLDVDSAKEVAEREAKVAAEIAIEETSAKLEETTGRPEFETAREVQSMDSPAPKTPNTAQSEYKIKSIKAAKGKTLKQVPLNKLVSWLKNYDELKKEGRELSDDVQMDAFHIGEFLEAAAIAKPVEPAP